MAEEFVVWAEEHERAEEYVKKRILEEKCRPGRYYPPSGALKELLRSSGYTPRVQSGDYRELNKEPAT